MDKPARKRGRKPKNDTESNPDTTTTTTVATSDDIQPSINTTTTDATKRRRNTGKQKTDDVIVASSERRATRYNNKHNGEYDNDVAMTSVVVGKVVPSMDTVVKVFCVHTEPNFSLPWQRKRQYSSSSSGFIISGKRVLTNAHSVEHYTQVKLKKRGSDTKYLATVLAIGTECDIG